MADFRVVSTFDVRLYRVEVSCSVSLEIKGLLRFLPGDSDISVRLSVYESE